MFDEVQHPRETSRALKRTASRSQVFLGSFGSTSLGPSIISFRFYSTFVASRAVNSPASKGTRIVEKGRMLSLERFGPCRRMRLARGYVDRQQKGLSPRKIRKEKVSKDLD